MLKAMVATAADGRLDASEVGLIQKVFKISPAVRWT
jgi:uncharacterized membrane protein YebE (DUF533 family)